MTFSALTHSTGVLYLLGWSLLHFLWQAALIALALGAVLIAVRSSSAQARYALCCAALALMALCPVVTFAWLAYRADQVPHTSSVTAYTGFTLLDHTSASVSLLERMTATADKTMPWILAVWITGVLLLLMRTIVASIAVRRMKTRAIVAAPESLLTLARQIGERLKITQLFQVRVSHAVTAPAVIGWLKPVILFPVASLTGLAPEQLEAMLAHELAHIRRRDYLVNALQVAMETLLFYHPAVWWVSQQIRREREHCCDDVAVSVTGSPLMYAKALYLLEEQRTIAPELTLGGNGGQLKMRINRLLTSKQSVSSSYGGVLGLVTITLLFLAVGFAVSGTAISKSYAQNPASSAATEATAIGQVTQNFEKLRLLEAPDVKYPPIAKAAHITGKVDVWITVSPKGEVTNADVIRGLPMLRQAALDSVIHYRFAPFTDSSDKPATAVVTVVFSLPESALVNDPKPDLSCTYYGGVPFAGHKGTCEIFANDSQPYYCRREDGDKQAQEQPACQVKINALEAWESRQNLTDSRQQFLRTWDSRRSNP